MNKEKIIKLINELEFYDEMDLLVNYIINIEQKLNKQKEVLDKIKNYLEEYRYTNIEDYSKIMEFYRKLEELLEEIE